MRDKLMFSDTDGAAETRRQICAHSTVARARRRVREQSGPGTTPPVPTWCTSGSNSAALPASPSSTKGASPAATPITLERNGRYPRRHRRSEKTRSNTRVPADGSRDGFGGAETHRSWSVARSSGKTARDWPGNGLQTRRCNAPRSFFALNVILGTNLPMTSRRSLQRIRPHAGRRVEDARNHVQRDFIVEEGTNRILWVDSNP